VNNDLKPGKGGFFTMTQETLDWFYQVMSEITNGYKGVEGDDLQDEGKSSKVLQGIQDYSKTVNGIEWEKSRDDFGTKLTAAMPFGTGEYRVTVVMRKNGSLYLDVRQWFDPKES